MPWVANMHPPVPGLYDCHILNSIDITAMTISFEDGVKNRYIARKNLNIWCEDSKSGDRPWNAFI